MEFSIPSFILFVTFFCFLLLLVLKSKSKRFIKTLPPGPRKLPLIGNIYQFFGSQPHQSLTSLANKYGPLMHLQLGEVFTLIVSSPEAAKEIMKTHDAIFASRPSYLAYRVFSYNATNIAFSSHGTYWSQLRKICGLELLSTKRVQSFKFIKEHEVSEMIKTILRNEGSVINLSKMIFSLTNAVIARAAFGKKCRHHESFLLCLEQGLDLIPGFHIADLYPSIKLLQYITGMRAKVERVHKKVDSILENIIMDHKDKEGGNGKREEDDLVDVFLKLQQQNDLDIPLSHNNIKAVILDIFVAGIDTSATTILWAMSELLKNPKIMEKAQAEVRRVFGSKKHVDETDIHQLKFLQSIIKETLRLHPPIPLLIPRKNKERCVINGYEIPPKTRTIVNAWAIGRDPRYWVEAERFKPERFLHNSNYYNFRGTKLEYIPFGSGRRLCPGIAFATPNIELPLANLLYHFDWKLPNGIIHEQFDMAESFASTLGRKTDLLLAPVCYHL